MSRIEAIISSLLRVSVLRLDRFMPFRTLRPDIIYRITVSPNNNFAIAHHIPPLALASLRRSHTLYY